MSVRIQFNLKNNITILFSYQINILFSLGSFRQRYFNLVYLE